MVNNVDRNRQESYSNRFHCFGRHAKSRISLGNIAVIIGIGVDIVDVNRIARLLDDLVIVLRKILVEREFKAELSERRLAAYLAKQFAAKEALSKALGTGVRASGLQSIKVLRDPYGKPYVELSSRPLSGKC